MRKISMLACLAFIGMPGLHAQESATVQTYRQLFEAYSNGNKSGSTVKALARAAAKANEKAFAQNLADEYIRKMDQKEIYEKDNLAFTGEFTTTTKSPGFNILFRDPVKINGIMKPHFVQDVLNGIIYKEEIAGGLKNRKLDVNWDSIGRNVRQYGVFGQEMLLRAKMIHLLNNGTAKEFMPVLKEYYAGYLEYEGPVMLNNIAWKVYEEVDGREDLLAASKWMEHILVKEPDNGFFLDTYASLLHKAGEKKKAFIIQQKAAKLQPNNEEIQANLARMKKDQ